MSKLPQTKITTDDVRLIRSFYHGGVRQAILAKSYGLSRSHVSRIVRGLRRGRLATAESEAAKLDLERGN